MNKQELIQTHQLFDRLRTEFSDETPSTPTIEETPTYDEVGVGSVDIHRSKSDHEDAVLALANDIADGLDKLSEQEVPEPEAEATVAK